MSASRLSLTARMGLMFMLAVTVVLSLAGLSFDMLSQHHFRTLDRQALDEKLEATRHILEATRDGTGLASELPKLRTLLGSHQELTANILSGDGAVLFSDPGAAKIPEHLRRTAQEGMWDWQQGEHVYRGISVELGFSDQPRPFTVTLMLDVTSHAHFLGTLQRWFWIGLTFSALLSGALGWMVARSGLRPLRQVTRVAASISTRSLQARIPLEPVPQELQQLVLSFNAMLARLEDGFLRLSNFSADIAHELRTPVSNLMTHTEVVLSRKRDISAYEDNLYANLEDLKRMSRIIDDMLFLAKADNGLIIPQRTRIELAEVVDKLFGYYRLLAEERGIQLLAKGAGQVLGGRLMLDRAVSNLLSNALRHTPEGQTISLSIEQTETTVSLAVSNPGTTIPPEQQARLFDRFYRGDPARREGSSHNAGLGLAISQSIMAAHGGHIGCTSADGITTMLMEFPRPSP